MKVSEAMNRDVQLAKPDDTIRAVAKIFGEKDIGFMPVEEDDRLVGMITDRDIAVRAVGENKDGTTLVGDIMTRDVKYCFEDQEVEEVAHNMGDQQLRRLPVINRDKRLVGVMSLADCARTDGNAAGTALGEIVHPGGLHSQAAQ